MTPEKELNTGKHSKKPYLKGGIIFSKIKALVDVVERVVEVFGKTTSLFNAGKGSGFTSDGNHLMDASIMDGKTLKAGCVSSVSNIKNPDPACKENYG